MREWKTGMTTLLDGRSFGVNPEKLWGQPSKVLGSTHKSNPFFASRNWISVSMAKHSQVAVVNRADQKLCVEVKQGLSWSISQWRNLGVSCPGSCGWALFGYVVTGPSCQDSMFATSPKKPVTCYCL